MAISSVPGVAAPFIPPKIDSAGARGVSEGTASPQTGASVFADGLEKVTALQSQADALAGQVATGSISDIHQFTAAAAKAQLGVQLTVALRNRAVDAYQDIMRMQV